MKKSSKRGRNILKAEVSHISNFGIWIIVLEKEYFLPFDNYPWFRRATIQEIQNVNFIREHHLRWPDLDIDLELNSLKNPEMYPLVFS